MKKTSIILIALLATLFTQCKKEKIDADASTNSGSEKVKVRCEIPLNNGNRSDFINLMQDGRINWSDGRECIYLAITGDNPQIIELEGFADGNPATLEFSGEIDKNIINEGESYEIWYFGNSMQKGKPGYVSTVENNNVISKIKGVIDTQSGRIEDLGLHHIASTTVTAVVEDGEIILPLEGKLTNKMAIALLDLENVTRVWNNNGMLVSDYSFEYNSTSKTFEFNVEYNSTINITGDTKSEVSYIVLLPNEGKDLQLLSDKNGGMWELYIHNGIEANKVYFKTASDGGTIEAFEWDEIYTGSLNGHYYVDLGLSVKWATCNVGSFGELTPGDFFSWAEIAPKESYTSNNYQYQQQQITSGIAHTSKDAATQLWGNNWMMPTKSQFDELVNKCTWELLTDTDNTQPYYRVTGPSGKHIILGCHGYKGAGGLLDTDHPHYWTSTPNNNTTYPSAYCYAFDIIDKIVKVTYYNKSMGMQIRPIVFEEK